MIKRWLYIILLCLISVPLIVYWVGGLIVGPYEGENGLFGLMISIYSDALSGQLSAWILLFSPLLLIAIWAACRQLQRIARH
ncbi:MAG: hypothetical protein GY727_05325 [Gammaproteobacteria bacterium]|nr:hypothetical protein [Gammaproteobacteria bacterium]MCP4091174.1 hypothetical protein [Gammaproteobacteria bacterium]MCP4277300.1 hypothetical protein [Gammaproteobacteria bacterium]MCP4831639.1 hypothetical protein [Gammaproteobacteria bacterium]MCP4927862.1 hypothetical protein [Gammaproteobacteria bacterium]